MQIIRHDMDKLAQARELQTRAKDLHLAPPPIVTWGAKIYEPNGEQIEEILAKSNSYTRNALNAIACQGTWVRRATTAESGVIGGGFADGQLGSKDVSASVSNAPANYYENSSTASQGSGETYFSFLAGYSDAAESIDSYVLGSEFGDGSGANQLNKGTSTRTSVWDSANHKFVTTFSRQFTNGYGSSQIIKEIGLRLIGFYGASTGKSCLVLRDVLASPITLTSGQTVILYYQLEATVA